MMDKYTIVYGRVSTNKQDISIDLQKKKCQQYCQVHDLENLFYLEDVGMSGKSFNRPMMKKALELIHQGQVDAFVVYKLDRLSRSMKDLSDFVHILKKKDLELKVVVENVDTGSASGMLFYNILGSMAQFERETISNRIKDALRHKKELKHKYSGIPPYGYELQGKHLGICPEEMKVIDEVVDLKRKWGYSFRRIAETLNFKGVKTKLGRDWSIRTTSNVYYKAV